jgi:two-component system, chemotaxis family, protein-glutamate methylesterase/glutaminase
VPKPRLVVIGGSSGAFEILLEVLPGLPAGLPFPIIVVLHLPPHRPSGIAELFSGRCRMPVREAEDKEILQEGVIYFAPPNYHLLVEREGMLALSIDPPMNYSRPSIDVLFESAAEAMGSGVTGILLSGANSDGAHGLQAIAAAGGIAVVEDPQSARTKTMPAAGLKACPAARIMRAGDIGAFIATGVHTIY